MQGSHQFKPNAAVNQDHNRPAASQRYNQDGGSEATVPTRPTCFAQRDSSVHNLLLGKNYHYDPFGSAGVSVPVFKYSR
jgi:hypothetical protein